MANQGGWVPPSDYGPNPSTSGFPPQGGPPPGPAMPPPAGGGGGSWNQPPAGPWPPAGGSPGGPPWNQPPMGPLPPGPPPGPTPPSRKPVWIVLAVIAAVAILGGGLAIALSGGDDSAEIGQPDTTDESSDTTDESSDTTDEPTDTTDEPTDTTDEATTTTDEATTTTEGATTTRPTLAPPPIPTAAPPTEPPTTAAPPPPPPPVGPTQEDLNASGLDPGDFGDPAWVHVPDNVAIPACDGADFPDAPLQAGSVILNQNTQQSAGSFLQSYANEQDAVGAFNQWQQAFECAPTDSLEITQLDFGAPICQDEFYYFADFFNSSGALALRSSIAAERCGKNIAIYYYDEDISLSVEESTARVETLFISAIARFAALPST